MEDINFILQTDWMFTQPIDSEHKKYVLMSYFQKIDELIVQNKLYPHFIELSLHMANLHTLIKEKVARDIILKYIISSYKKIEHKIPLSIKKEILSILRVSHG